jgi:hypothetical protein
MTLTIEKVAQKMLAAFELYIKIYPVGENSPNLITLVGKRP